MYGTVADLRIKSGKENEVLDLMRQWENAEDPGQDAWYQQFRELLEEDPVWKDGEVVYSA